MRSAREQIPDFIETQQEKDTSLSRLGRFSLASLSRAERFKRPMACIAAIGSMAIASSAGSSGKVVSLEAAGFNSGRVWVTDRAEAEAEADRIVSLGGKIIRVASPYTQGGANIDNDAERLCVMAEVATEKKLDVMVSFEGRFRKDAKLGYIATIASEKQKFLTANIDMLNTLYGENGCAEKPGLFTISFVNEPNNPLFVRSQYVNGEWAVPEQVVSLYEYMYSRMHKEADKLSLNLQIIGGELRQRNAIAFIRKMGDVIHERKIISPIMDEFGQHLYLNGPDAENYESVFDTALQIQKAVKDNVGDIDMSVTELGAISDTQPGKEQYYDDKLPPHIKPVSEIAQGHFYHKFMDFAACNGIKRVLFFHVVDDRSILRTGLYRPDLSKKRGKGIVQEAIGNVHAGITC